MIDDDDGLCIVVAVARGIESCTVEREYDGRRNVCSSHSLF